MSFKMKYKDYILFVKAHRQNMTEKNDRDGESNGDSEPEDEDTFNGDSEEDLERLGENETEQAWEDELYNFEEELQTADKKETTTDDWSDLVADEDTGKELQERDNALFGPEDYANRFDDVPERDTGKEK